jgi:hypothetical protein
MFPVADPIPIPAPIWLLKLLSLLTLGLHFAAVMMLIGSLILVIWLNFRGRSSGSLDQVRASWVLAKRLPVIMTYVVNLGVPPLLFLQVMYGQQIYSSSVIIGVPWISVIILVTLAYWLIYKTTWMIEQRRAAWIPALLSFGVIIGVGQIYAMNMTLMLRPELWNDMYNSNPHGMQGFSGDPTTMPRFLFVFAGGPLVGGLWTALIANMKYLDESVRKVLHKAGSAMAVLGAVLMGVSGYLVISKQPADIMQKLSTMPLATIGMYACAATIALSGLLAVVLMLKGKESFGLSTLAWVVSLLAPITATLPRDGIRDAALAKYNFDVYKATIYPNWSVLIVFLLLFVIMLGVVAWLLMIMRGAEAPKEQISI